ncbi:MAG: N-acetylmuramoyl-L-alanine amidase [Bacteroidota bacterium]
MNRPVLLFVLAFLLGTVPLCAQNRSYVQAQVQSGETLLSLLRKYHISNPCNVSHFYRINQMKREQPVLAGKTYKLPIHVYTYNDLSIRSTIGIKDRPQAERIQAYNESMASLGFQRGDYRKTRTLWVSHHEFTCPEQKTIGPAAPTDQVKAVVPDPAVVTSADIVTPARGGNPYVQQTRSEARVGRQLRGTYDILGKKYADVYLEDLQLKGCVYYIVAGHGGPDPGAVGTYQEKSLCEDEYAYDIALRLSRRLIEHGATVYIITRDPDDGIREGEILPCDKDEKCWEEAKIPINQKSRLLQRSNAVNKLYKQYNVKGVKSQRMVVLHVDSNNQSAKIDLYFYHRFRDQASKNMAQIMQQRLKMRYQDYRKEREYSGTVTARDLHMLRETKPVGVFIELANIRNKSDQARLVVEGNRQLMANWLCEGLLEEMRK